MCTLELTELSSIYQVSREEDSFIWAIARRASILWENHGRYIPTIAFAVAVEQCHANVCRLKLQELLESRNSDFAHDVAGTEQISGAVKNELPKQHRQRLGRIVPGRHCNTCHYHTSRARASEVDFAPLQRRYLGGGTARRIG